MMVHAVLIKFFFFCPQVRILTTFFLPLFLEFFERKTSKSLLIGLQEQLLKIAAAFFFCCCNVEITNDRKLSFSRGNCLVLMEKFHLHVAEISFHNVF